MNALRNAFVSLCLVLAIAIAGIAPAQAIPKLLLDMHTGEVLYAEDADRPWHPASLTKLMTALLAFEAIERGQVGLSTPVISSANALSVPPSKMGFPVDTAIRMEDALYLLIVKSANDIAVAIGETISGNEAEFVALMNRRAAELGLTATHFTNPHGLHDPAQVTSARDMAVLSLVIRARYPQYDPMFGTQTVEHAGTRSETNNILLSRFAGTDGMKTGYVCASGLNLVATAARNGRNLMAVVLGAGSGRERGEMAAQLLHSGFSGGYRGTGLSIVEVANRTGMPPVDMRPSICGAQAADYRDERIEAFPLGMDGQLSYLNDEIVPPSYRMTVLGRVREVPLPRPRPGWMPQVAMGDGSDAILAEGPAGDGGMLANEEIPVTAPVGAPLPPPRPQF